MAAHDVYGMALVVLVRCHGNGIIRVYRLMDYQQSGGAGECVLSWHQNGYSQLLDVSLVSVHELNMAPL